MLNNDPRLADPTLLLLAGKMALAKRQTSVDTAWEHSVGLAALLKAAGPQIISVQVEYAGTDEEPEPLKGEVYHYARQNQPYSDGMQKLLDEARAYEAAKREGTA